ncbi:hypothetical protein ACVGWB_00315 [Enterobacter mori]
MAPIFGFHLVVGFKLFIIFRFTVVWQVWTPAFYFLTRRYLLVRSRR